MMLGGRGEQFDVDQIDHHSMRVNSLLIMGLGNAKSSPQVLYRNQNAIILPEIMKK
jgi:hypothetical protein